jgi:TonB family protein
MKLSRILLCLLFAGGTGLLSAQEVQIPAPQDATMVIKSVEAVFPPDLLARGVTAGRARIAVSVNGAGLPTDEIVESETDPALGQAALEAVRQWVFNRPAISAEDGPQILNIELSFGDQTAAADIPWAYRTPVLNQLDRIPNPKNVVRPDPAQQSALPPLRGRHNLTVAYYIDQTGHVRLPSVVVGIDPGYNRLALDAVAQWQFDPPLIQGKPTAVRSQQTFRYGSQGDLLPDVVIKPPVRIAGADPAPFMPVTSQLSAGWRWRQRS